VQRQELVDIARKEDDTPNEAIAIRGLSVNMNVEGHPENFYGQTLQREEGAAGSSVFSRLSNVLLARGHFGLDICVCSRSSTIHRSSISAGRRPSPLTAAFCAELQSKGKHGGISFRVEPDNCHQLNIPHAMTAYTKWAANQSTAKNSPFWFFFEELKKAAGTYPPVWRCVGCHPSGDAALALYEQKKDLKAMPRGIVRYGWFHSARALAHCLVSIIERRTCVH